MSTILDALRRAERERNAMQGGLERPPPAAPADARALPWPLISVCVVLAFACGGLLIALLKSRPAEAPAAVVAAAPALTAAAAAAPETVIPPAAAQTISSLDDLVDGSTPGTAPPPQDFQAQPAGTAVAATAVEPEPEPQPPPREMEVQHLTLAPAPPPQVLELKDMPPEFRANFPALALDVHVHDDDPGRRFVMINGHRYREGDALREGPQVSEITPEGVVLGWRGQKVLLPIAH